MTIEIRNPERADEFVITVHAHNADGLLDDVLAARASGDSGIPVSELASNLLERLAATTVEVRRQLEIAGLVTKAAAVATPHEGPYIYEFSARDAIGGRPEQSFAQAAASIVAECSLLRLRLETAHARSLAFERALGRWRGSATSVGPTGRCLVTERLWAHARTAGEVTVEYERPRFEP